MRLFFYFTFHHFHALSHLVLMHTLFSIWEIIIIFCFRHNFRFSLFFAMCLSRLTCGCFSFVFPTARKNKRNVKSANYFLFGKKWNWFYFILICLFFFCVHEKNTPWHVRDLIKFQRKYLLLFFIFFGFSFEFEEFISFATNSFIFFFILLILFIECTGKKKWNELKS